MKKILYFLCLTFASGNLFSGNLTAQNSLSSIIKDINAKLGEIVIDKVTYNQSLEVLDEAKGKVSYQSVAVNEKGESVKSGYEFYISDIDKNTIVRKPSGKKFFVNFSLNNKQKFIKYFKEEKFDSYTDFVEIQTLDADKAQTVSDLLKTAIPLVKNSTKTFGTALEALTWLQSNLGEVKDKNNTNLQSFSYDEKKNYLVSFSKKITDPKGNVTDEKYSFNVLDVNKSKVVAKVTGTTLLVSIEIKNNDKYIRYSRNNELQSYDNNFDILAEDIDQARGIIAAMNVAIEKSKAQLPEFKNAQNACDFIKDNTGEVNIDQKVRKQKFEFTPGNGTLVNYLAEDQDSKGKTITSQYEFYLADIEPGSVNFKVNGKKIIIQLAIAGKYKFIKYSKDNALQNYTDDMELNMDNIETAREVVSAFNTAIKGIPETPVKFANIQEAIKFLQNNVAGATVGTDQYKLVLDGNATEPYSCTYSRSQTDSKGVTNDESYLFYPYLLDANTVKVQSEGKYLSVSVQTNGKKSFIKKVKKDQNSFVSDFSIMTFDVKKAKDLAIAMRYLISNGVPKAKSWGSKQQALDYIKENTASISGSGKEIKQKFETADDNPCKITFTVNTSDEKGKTSEQVFEFNLSDVNKQGVDFKTQGSGVVITVSCKNKQKLIKVYKDGAQQSFGSDVDMLCSDVDIAKNIAEAIKSASTQCE